MKNIATLIALIFATFLVGCAENPISSNEQKENPFAEMKNVNVQMMYNGKPAQWQASFVAVDMGIEIKDRKPLDDTNAYNLGKFHKGATIRIVYDNTINVRQTDNFLSIRVIIGNDTSTVYGVEGLYTIHTVK